MDLSKTVELELAFSEQGCAMFAPTGRARLTLHVSDDDSPNALKEVELGGAQTGRRAIAAAILATAESPLSGFHMHIDEEVNGPVFRSPDGFTLTISRYEK